MFEERLFERFSRMSVLLALKSLCSVFWLKFLSSYGALKPKAKLLR